MNKTMMFVALWVMLTLSASPLWAQTPAIPQATPPTVITTEVGVELIGNPGTVPVAPGPCQEVPGLHCYEFQIGGVSFATHVELESSEAETREVAREALRQATRAFSAVATRLAGRIHVGEVVDSTFFGLPPGASAQQRLDAAQIWGHYLEVVVPGLLAQESTDRADGDSEMRDALRRLEDRLRGQRALLVERIGRLERQVAAGAGLQCVYHNEGSATAAAFNAYVADAEGERGTGLAFHVAPELSAIIGIDPRSMPSVFSGGARARLHSRWSNGLALGFDFNAGMGYAPQVGAVFNAGGRFLIGYQPDFNGFRISGGWSISSFQALGSGTHRSGDLGFLTGPVMEAQVGPATFSLGVFFGEADDVSTAKADSSPWTTVFLGAGVPIEFISRRRAPARRAPVIAQRDCTTATPTPAPTPHPAPAPATEPDPDAD